MTVQLWTELEADALAYLGDPSARPSRTFVTIRRAFRNPGFRLTARWRIAKYLYGRVPFVPQFLRQSLLHAYSSDISLMAHIAPGARLPHPIGIVIGDEVVLETGVTIMQHVTLGGNGGENLAGRQTPIVRSGAFIGPHALLLGPVEVPAKQFVRAASVVTTKTIFPTERSSTMERER